jgi:hypothetical protein
MMWKTTHKISGPNRGESSLTIAAGFASDVQKLAAKAGKNKNALVALSGQVSSRLREELEKRGFMVRDRLAPGPLK